MKGFGERLPGMSDSTITKVDSSEASKGKMGQKYLASGKNVSMRLWEEDPGIPSPSVTRDYEVVGYMIKGAAALEIEGEKIRIEQGTSWVVPKGARHTYVILQPMIAVEATSPPAELQGRDAVE